MRLASRILEISSVLLTLVLYGAVLHADSIPVSGSLGYASGEEYYFNIEGFSGDFYSTSPDAPNFLPSCNGCAPTLEVPAWPQSNYSGGSVDGLVAAYLDGGIWFDATQPLNVPPGPFVVDLPGDLSGTFYGIGANGQELFQVNLSGVGDAFFSGNMSGSGYAFVMGVNGQFEGTATIVYEESPEPPPIVLLASALGVAALIRPFAGRAIRDMG